MQYPSSYYLSFAEHTALIRERARQPITFDGATWYPTIVAAEMTGRSAEWLKVLARRASHEYNTALTTANGARFVRVPRCRDDERAPIYWDVESLRS